MHSVKPPSDPELLLPPLRTTATIISLLTAAFLIVIIVSHLARGAPLAPGTEAGTAPVPTSDTQLRGAAAYPYTDPRTLGLY